MGGLDDNRVIGELVRRAPRPTARVTPARVAAKPAATKKRVAVAARAASPLKAPKKRPR